MASFDEEVTLLTEYKQFTVIYKGKDTSPEAFLVWKGQQAAFETIDKIRVWSKEYLDDIGDDAIAALEAILD